MQRTSAASRDRRTFTNPGELPEFRGGALIALDIGHALVVAVYAFTQPRLLKLRHPDPTMLNGLVFSKIDVRLQI